MPERARRIASKLRQFIGDRRRAKRTSVRLPITVSLAVSHISPNGFRRQTSLDGHTLDVSSTGLALVLPAIRIAEHYLSGEDRRLWLKIELPSGPLEMQVAPVRYESLDEHKTENGYLIGVHITEITEERLAIFNDFIKRLPKRIPSNGTY